MVNSMLASLLSPRIIYLANFAPPSLVPRFLRDPDRTKPLSSRLPERYLRIERFQNVTTSSIAPEAFSGSLTQTTVTSQRSMPPWRRARWTNNNSAP